MKIVRMANSTLGPFESPGFLPHGLLDSYNLLAHENITTRQFE